ncbi:MAG: prepilin-type N-terminal cleavage/methylation domain-containing protein [Patescibacteria group bacterium]
MFRKNNNEKGFTLVETLVSLVILSVALIPILNLSSGVTKTSAIVRDNLIAAGLAQEGVEVVRAIRDTNWFNTREFDSGLDAGAYQVQWDSTSLLSLGGNPVLNLNNGIYTYSGGTPTKFRRTITLTKINAGELKVVSTVAWSTQSSASKSLGAESHLFNWK